MKRVQFELSVEKLNELEKLMSDTDTPTKRELFNNALTLLEWAVDEVANNRKIGSISQDGESYIELAMPIFKSIKHKDNNAATSCA